MFENIARMMIKVYFITVLDFFGGWKNVKKKRTNKTLRIQAKSEVSMEEHSQDIRRTESC